MTWGRTSDQDEHRARSRAAVWDRPTPIGVNRPPNRGVGSRGGAPIWVMAEAFIPPSHWTSNQEADPDGFAVFGRYPKGFLSHVIDRQLLGRVQRHEVLHVCSGTLSDTEAWTVDMRAQARPRVQALGTSLPFRSQSFRAVMLDPPYSDEYARNLYGTENPRPSWLLKEAARVVMSSGRVGILHVAVPFSPPGCRLVNVYGVSTGVGFRIRAFTIYEREQESLPLSVPDAPRSP